MAKNSPKPVRVVIREVTYARKAVDQLDRPILEYPVAYGPGRPEIEPTRLLGPEFDPESEEAKKAFKDFKQGELIELLPDDYVRLINGKAVVDADKAEQMAVEAEEEILDVRTASVDDLARWIEQEQPTVQKVVDASGGEADLAHKLLKAESQATDEEPRKGVLDALTAVIARG